MAYKQLSKRYIASYERVARKTHECLGNGAGRDYRKFAEGHTPIIQPGERYVEYIGATGAYQSGTAHCMACAEAFYLIDDTAA